MLSLSKLIFDNLIFDITEISVISNNIMILYHYIIMI